MIQTLMRWLSWLLSGVAVLLLILLAGVFLYTQTDHFRALLRSQLLAAVNDSLHGEAKIKEITGSLWSTVHFHDVLITHNGEPILSAPRISARLGLLGQIFGLLSLSRVHVGQIHVVEPKFNLVQDEENNWNIARLLKERDEPEEPARFAVFLDEVKISDGNVRVRTADGREAEISSLLVAGEIGLPRSGFQANFGRLEFALASDELLPSRWETAFSIRQTEESSALKIRTLNLSTEKSRLKATGNVQNLTSPTTDLKIELTKLSAAELTKMAPSVPLRQDLSGSFTAKGPLSALQVSGSLKAPDGQLLTWVVTDWTGAAPQYRGAVEARAFVLEKVLQLTDLGGNVNGRVSFEGSSAGLTRASGNGSVRGLVVQSWEVGDVTGSGKLDNKKNLGVTAQAKTQGGRADVKATVALLETPSYEGTVSARSLEIKKTLGEAYSGPAANISADAWIKGAGTELNRLRVQTKLTVYPSRIGDVQIKEGHAEASLHDGALILRQARLVADGTTLNASGKIGSLRQNAAGTINYNLNVQEMRPWLELAGLDGSGNANVKGTVSGSLKSPRLEGRAALNALRLAENSLGAANLSWKLAASDSNEWRGQIGVAAKDVNAGVPLRSVDANITLDGTRPITVRAEISARDVEQRAHRIAGRLIYTDEKTDMLLREVSLQLPNGVWRNRGPAHLVVRGKTIEVDDFLLQRGAETVSVSGLTGLEGPQDLVVQVERFPIGDFRVFFRDWPEVSGNLSLTAKVTGTAVQPLVDGTLNADRLMIGGQSYLGLTGRTSYEKERLRIDLRLLQDKTHGLDVNGVLPVYIGWGGGKSPAVLGDANLRLRSEGLSPAFLGVLSKDVQNVQGSLSMDIVLRGPIRDLAPSGTLHFQNGRAGVAPLGISVNDVDIQASLAPGAIQITSLNARSGEGRLTGTGRIALKQYAIGGIAVTLNAESFQVINTRQYQAVASGKLLASGSLQEPLLRGGLTVRGSFRPDLSLLKREAPPDPTIVVVRHEAELAAARRQSIEKAKAKKNDLQTSPLYQRLGLDMTVQISRGTWIYLDEGSVEVAGELQVGKERGEDLSIAGTIQGVRGSYSFQGRRLRLEKGELIFTGGGEIDPVLDVVAQYRLPEYRIDVVIGGTLNKPTLAFRSDPPLEQADILSVLLFGKPVATLSEGQQVALQTQALKAAANFIASDLRQSVARKVGLDVLEFDFGDQLTEGRVGIGKYVREDVFVSASQEFGETKQQEVAIEYNITPNWQIRSSTTTDGESGVDIFWKKSY